ncbi:hypothetical protein KI440_02675 [Candidatus Saccharibacteria bacterium TM7i]|nr:hypothetical protein KI440_02675 [Candidatus Saccharibacteria bacterium TM7i]
MQDPFNPSNQDAQSTNPTPTPAEPQTPQQFSAPGADIPTQPTPLAAQQPVTPQPYTQPVPSYQQPMKKKSNKTLITLLIVGGVVLLAGIAAALYFTGALAKFTSQNESGTNTNVTTGEGSNATDTPETPSTESSADTSTVDQKLAESVEAALVKSGAADAKVTATQQSKTNTTLTIEVTEAPITMTTLRTVLTRIANTIPSPQTATLTFKSSNPNLPQSIERIGLGSALVGAATNDTATFDIAKARDLL